MLYGLKLKAVNALLAWPVEGFTWRLPPLPEPVADIRILGWLVSGSMGRVPLKRAGTVVPEPPKVPENESTPNTEKSRAP